MMLFLCSYTTIQQTAIQQKRTSGIVKEESLGSLIETEDEDEPGLDKVVRNMKEPKEAIENIKRYEDILKSQNKKINIVGKQREY